MLTAADRLRGRFFKITGFLEIGLGVLGLALLPGVVAAASFLIVSGLLVITMGYGVVRQATFRFWRIWHFVGFPIGALVTGAVVYLYPPTDPGAKFGLVGASVLAIVFWISTLGWVRRPRGGGGREARRGMEHSESTEGKPRNAELEKPQIPDWVLPAGLTVVGALTVYEFRVDLPPPWDYVAASVSIFIGLVAGGFVANMQRERPGPVLLMILLLVLGATVGLWRGLEALRAFSMSALLVVILARFFVRGDGDKER